ncbi:MAG: bifunctional folylpolyglutamate synthase/dihydrofolate synthase [Ruminococcus sp.]|nr:bifunctional folylpolyglutamate synthase/dihydrofolate synthase [Ruminococcus sp.]
MNGFEYIKIAAERGSKLGLERITELCDRLGNPQNKTHIIHIAGTNGKGSFGAMLSAVLVESGYKVGGFSSPALTDLTDSFCINGKSISADDFNEVMADIIPICEDMADKPTEFEVLTAAAYELFCRENCDIALIECGMGGDTDSTNVAEYPVLSVITNIALDHTAFLGGTISEIARCKAGIIKSSRPVLYGGNDDEALEIIRSISQKNGSQLIITDKDRVTVVESDINGIIYEDKAFGRLKSPLIGSYQKYNLANVLTAVEILRSMEMNIPDNAVKSGIEKAVWQGRFEVVSRNPLIIYDGAHNPDGIIQAAESISRYISGKIALLIGVMADKEYGLYPEILGKFIDKAFTVIPDNPRSLDSDTLAAAFEAKGIDAVSCGSVENGFAQALEYAKSRNIPLIVLGSLYMYGEFRKCYAFSAD